MNAEEIASAYFNIESFYPNQKELVESVLSGRDVIAVMPTGSGKSLCYQLPAIMLPGVTLVVSPLISLMKNQVAYLKSKGIYAECVDAYSEADFNSQVYYLVEQGNVKILYVSPERLLNDQFLSFIGHVHVSFIAVDEAHCISLWGESFRPSYKLISKFIDTLGYRPVIGAYTASATPAVRKDIIKGLGLKNPYTVVSGFNRPNLFLGIYRYDDKDSVLDSLLSLMNNQSGIVYCLTRNISETVYDRLKENGVNVGLYHAGLSIQHRNKAQAMFIRGEIKVMVATSAFGMGIDKKDIRFIFHYNPPLSIEDYYQQIGRAGRDGQSSICQMVFNDKDFDLGRWMITSNSELLLREHSADKDEYIIAAFEKLDAMYRFCVTPGCYRHKLLAYFGEDSPAVCGRCNHCFGVENKIDVSEFARTYLKIVENAGSMELKTLLEVILEFTDSAGNKDSESDDSRVVRVLNRVMEEKLLILEPDGEGDYTVSLSESGSRFLHGDDRIYMNVN